MDQALGRFADWLWRRYRADYITAVSVVAFLFTVVTIMTPVLAAGAPFFGLSLGETLTILPLELGIIGASVLFGSLSLPDERSRLAAWSRGDRSDAAGLAEVIVSMGERAATRSVVMATIGHLGVIGPLAAHYAHLGWSGLLAVEIALATVMGASLLILGVGFHMLQRPVLVEVAEHLPMGMTLSAPSWSIRGRLLSAVSLAVISAGTVGGAATEAVDGRAPRILAAAGVSVLWLGYVLALYYVGIIAPTLTPVVDLSRATVRVRRGDFSQRVEVTSTDEFGELAMAFNEMQHGLQEREALQAAFGSYVDPGLAQRLLDSGSSMFEGEDLVVTVLFADVRDFTSYSESVESAEAVELLNRLFDVMVPVLHQHGGHANHYLGDGLLAVFGAPNPLPAHADAAVAAAVEIQRRVRADLGDQLRLGIGINTGQVIAGTVGGGGRHEFTVIGNTVNVAARVEQLTKDTGDSILITEATRTALSAPRPRSTKRGDFTVRGKAAKVTLHAVNPFARATSRSNADDGVIRRQ